MYQAHFFVIVSVIGWMVARRLLADRRRWLAGALGLVVGTTLLFWLALAARAVAAMGAPYVNVWWLLGALGVVAAFAARRGPRFTRREVVVGLVSIVLMIATVLVFFRWNYSRAWVDSLELIAVGELVRMGETFEGHELLSRRPLFYGVFHALSPELDVEYLWAWVPATAATFLFAFCALLADFCRTLGVRRWLAYGLPLVGTLLLVSSDFGRLQLSLQHIHLMYGERFFLFAVLMWTATRDDVRSEMWLAIGVLTPTVCMRLEAVLFLPLIILVAIVALPIRATRVRELTLLLSLLVLVAGALLVATVDRGSTFVDGKRALMMLAMGLVMLAVALVRRRNWRRWWRWADPLARWTLFALALGIAVVIFVEFDTMAVSSIVAALNFTWAGMWEFLWWALAVWLVIGSASRKARFEHDAWFSTLTTTYVLFLMPMTLMRDAAPYRLGGMDSLNRMMMHVLPCLVFFALVRLAAATTSKAGEASSSPPDPLR